MEGSLILIGGQSDSASGSDTGPSDLVRSGGMHPPQQTDQTVQDIARAKKGGLLPFLLLSFGSGLLALLTPCVFPIIPITVSYFTKRKAGERGGGIGGASAYCLGIITTFTIIGVGVTAIFGGDRLSRIATNPYVNVGFALLFIVLALNLMGLFEIPVPAGLANRAQSSGAKRSGYVQPFLLGLAFSLTTFTCTTAYVGTLLATAAKGGKLYPVLGMLGFSTAFALPFFLLALFPSALSKLPKSGSWMVTLKGFMGLLELAAALKFLSNADLVWGRGVLTRPVFLVIWAAIGVAAGLYLLGIVHLPKDDGARIGPKRRAIGVATALVGLYCLAAVKGAPLGWFEAFPPPSPYPYSVIRATAQDLSNAARRTSKADGPLVWTHDYNAALQQAKAEGRPLLINFTGVTCVNCRLMEKNVFPQAPVVKELRNYVLVELYTDRGTPADDKNQALEEKLAHTVALPAYLVVSPEGKTVSVAQGQQPAADFVTFLKKGRGEHISSAL